MRTVRGVRSLVVGIAAASSALAITLPGAAFATTRSHVAQPRTIAAPALPRGSHVAGRVSASQRIEASVFLRPRNEAALAAYAAAVSNLRSPLFRHYLARGEFATKFGATPQEVTTVATSLRGAGLQVVGLSANRLDLTVTGTASRFSSAFDTTLANVRLPDGSMGRATTTAVHLPSSIASSVVTVIGLNDLLRAHTSLVRLSDLRHPTKRGIGRSFPSVHSHGSPGSPSACSAALGATQQGYGGITDDQVAHAYGVDGLYGSGDFAAGQTIAIYELEPFAASDIAAFDQCYFGASHTSQVTTVNVDGGPGTGYGSGESALDIENVSAIAPHANIRVYQAPNNAYGSIDAYNRIVSDDIAQSVTSSWGFCESDALLYSPGSLVAENLIFEQAAAQGQTVFNSSGDAGNDSCAYQNSFPTSPVLTVDDPASQPYVVGVGGTTAVTVNQPPAQQVWNDGSYGGAGGGGVSRFWAQPPWLGASANAISSRTPCSAPTGEVCRTVPDVTAFADEYTGITVYIGGGWTTIGGTSSSSPFWAAMLAEINASATCQASSMTARGVGFASPLLYHVAANATGYASGFSDVTLGNNDVFNLTAGTYRAKKGYDLASGLGSPELTPAPGVLGPGLAASLCAAAQGGTTATLSTISPKSGPPTGGTPFVLNGHGFMPGGVPDVAHVSFGTSSAASFVVVSDTKITGVTSSASTPTSNSVMNGLSNKTGGVLVSVTTTDHDVAVGPSFHYAVQHAGLDVPTIVQVGPTGGRGAGGNTVSIYGTGFSGATHVTFGGVPAKSYKVLSDVQINAVAPKWARSQCLAASDKGKLGLCQTQIQITGPGGKSTIVPAKKPYAGFLNTNQLGQIVVPSHCKCEAYPTITEYDYATSYSTTKLVGFNGKPFLGDPNGDDFLVLDGTGINVLTFNWVNFGPANSEYSQDYGTIQIAPSGTSMQVFSQPDPNPGPNGDTIPVSFNTVAGNSNSKPFTYAPIQVVTSLSTEVLPSAGGTSLTINGGGFLGAQGVEFDPTVGNNPPVTVAANFKVVSATKITLPSPSMVPGAYEVSVCGKYGCGGQFLLSGPSSSAGDTVDVIFPGTTAVTSAEAHPGSGTPRGSTAGGTTFEIQGTNFGALGDVTVTLVDPLGETVQATGVVAGPSATDPGATESILVTSPPSLGGYPGLDLVVVTGDNGASAVTTTALFDYT